MQIIDRIIDEIIGGDDPSVTVSWVNIIEGFLIPSVVYRR